MSWPSPRRGVAGRRRPASSKSRVCTAGSSPGEPTHHQAQGGRSPRLRSGGRNWKRTIHPSLTKRAVLADEGHEQVRRAGRDRDHQPAAPLRQLRDQALRGLSRRGMHRDRVVRGLLGMPSAAVPDRSPRRCRPQAPRACGRAASPSSGTRSTLITRRASLASTAAEYPDPVPISSTTLVALQTERLADGRHHPGLGDGLLVADGEGRVVVGAVANLLRHEPLARHSRHRGEHALVADAAMAQLALHHAGVVGPGSWTASPSDPAVWQAASPSDRAQVALRASPSAPKWGGLVAARRCRRRGVPAQPPSRAPVPPGRRRPVRVWRGSG